MKALIAVLAGDGIGPEVVAGAMRVLEMVAAKYGHQFTYDECIVGGASIDAHGVPLVDSTLEACKHADAILFGAVGGPKWDNAPVRVERGLLQLRKDLGLYANLRPVKTYPQLSHASPLKDERLKGVDLLVLRELTGGLYYGEPRGRTPQADGSVRVVDTLAYTTKEIRRIVDLAFRLAQGRRKHVTSVDKANVLESGRYWREMAIEVAQDYPDVKLAHQLVDSCAMRLIQWPTDFDVIVTENMFGDILTDEAGVLCGSLGMLPSASLGDGLRGLYEPIHGSAPDIAGKGIANPVGTILSAALLLRYSLKLDAEALAIENAVERAIADGFRTADIAAKGETVSTTTQMTDAILARIG
ncbi:MAG: 3-isopropylmalate dehydrogenase [Chloroflexi bacterium]|nr:3-isopropylmalate dehydrogenase [Chloroflexota bacterium]